MASFILEANMVEMKLRVSDGVLAKGRVGEGVVQEYVGGSGFEVNIRLLVLI